jgi:hypothetical protein
VIAPRTRSDVPAGHRPLKAVELTGEHLSRLRCISGLSRAEAGRRAGVNHATLRLAELEVLCVRLTPKNAGLMIKAYRDMGLELWLQDGASEPKRSRDAVIVNLLNT